MTIAPGWETIGWDADVTEVLNIVHEPVTEVIHSPLTTQMAAILPFPHQQTAFDDLVNGEPYPKPRRRPFRPTWRAVVVAPVLVEAINLLIQH